MPAAIPLGYVFPPEPILSISTQDPQYPKMANNRHDEKVGELERELKKSGNFTQVIPFYSYSKNGCSGEVDILALGAEPEWYEVKYRHGSSKLQMTLERFQKFKRAFPDFNGRAYYITCNGIALEITNILPEPAEEGPQKPALEPTITTYK